ncbi:PLP-dependent transferase [Acrodontium crateriforme]|uniref:cystathionine gamma-synthase n=1 Tax=Acrodontium crateriforme TaxID=150365 RepID=A0AAQ3M2U5_9PEZI|nr:PLP-dependent transferase [Acrodontium crateriforme]
MAAVPSNDTVGQTIPQDTPHAVSVSLPTWEANVAYEEGEKWVVDKMQCGYPRFFIHPSITRLAEGIVAKHGSPETEKAMLFPTSRVANRCVEFLTQQNSKVQPSSFRILDLGSQSGGTSSPNEKIIVPKVTAVLYPSDLWPTAKVFWQHTGEGISSRRAEFCQKAFDEQVLVEQTKTATKQHSKGPRRYQRPMSTDVSAMANANGTTKADETTVNGSGVQDSATFVEERFGRNLNVAFATQAKLAIRRRIAGSLIADSDLPDSLEEPADKSREYPEFSENDVYIYSCGMNAIYNAHRILRLANGDKKSIMYGFPYVDTLKILQKFGPGADFFGHANADDLDDLQRKLESGERYLSLFCEFPGNPLLRSPDLKRIRALADKYDFAVVVDETIGNFLNVHVLPYADIVVSSLTKVFSGDSNVMGGSLIVNPRSRYYKALKQTQEIEFEDNHFEEDSVYLERNSRDFAARIKRINHTAEVIADVLAAHPCVKKVFYPKHSDTKEYYDHCRLPGGGYGGLLSATFHTMEDAQVFYDHLDTQKGPSLGTNFTLTSPFVILAHYGELEWAAQYGCEASLVRFSIGLEDTETLRSRFEAALAVAQSKKDRS